MKLNLTNLLMLLFITSCSLAALAQKINVGFDKSADFKQFKSYTWAEPTMPTSRPLLYARIIDSVDHELESKGLARVDKDGDLALIPAGGMEFGMNVAASAPVSQSYSGPPPAVNATMWTGAAGFSNLMAPYVPEGTLALTFVDRSQNKVVWFGTVKEKLDMEQKDKSLEKIDKAISKLLKRYPPEAKGVPPSAK